MELSTDQQKALNQLLKWFNNKNKNQYITLGGYAGTGKGEMRLYVVGI